MLKKIISEVICLLVLLYFFQDGIYKLSHLKSYQIWFSHAPYFKNFSPRIGYCIPIAETICATGILFKKSRAICLCLILAGLVIAILQIMAACFFTTFLFFPFHFLWFKPGWLQVLIVDLGIAWLIFMVLVSSKHITSKKIDSVAKAG